MIIACVQLPLPSKKSDFLMAGGDCTQASMLIIYMTNSYHVHALRQHNSAAPWRVRVLV